MRSNYRKIGPFIRKVEDRNTNGSTENLLGVSVSKAFMPSIANTVGTDFSSYRVVRRNQFTYIPDTSRRGDKIGIALLDGFEQGLVSQAYTVFEISDKEQLDPGYLMMWFRRPEFDRYARYMSHGSVREIFEWEDMCNVSLPIPSIDKQREIVAEYNAIQDRIKLNEQIIQKLEETAQAIYKQWFVDFEFPNEEGKPYKSSGGEMVDSELGEIPKGWEVVKVKDYARKVRSGGTPNRGEPAFWNSEDIPWLKTGEIANKVLTSAEEYISKEGMLNSAAKLLPINSVLVAMYGEGKTKGQSGYLRFEAATNQACCAIICENQNLASLLYFFFRANQERIASLANGGAQPNLSKELIEDIRIIKPTDSVLRRHPFVKIIDHCESLERENSSLSRLADLVRSKLATAEG